MLKRAAALQPSCSFFIHSFIHSFIQQNINTNIVPSANVLEMIELFDIADVNQSASSFNLEKLRWLNQQHIKGADAARLGDELAVFLELSEDEIARGPAPAPAGAPRGGRPQPRRRLPARP